MKKILLIIAIALCIFQMVVLAIDIDVGSTAIDRGLSYQAGGVTVVDKTNPANETGTITSIEIFATSGYDLPNCEVATFYVVSGTFLSTRGTASLGTVTGGSKQTFPVSIPVTAGDYIGIYFTAGGAIERDDAGSGYLILAGDQIPCTNAEFTLYSPRQISLYGKGTTAEGNAIWFGFCF